MPAMFKIDWNARDIAKKQKFTKAKYFTSQTE
jgi:hypothetical protein